VNYLEMKFVLATENPGKLLEMRDILSEAGLEIVSRKELGIGLNIAETGVTFMENALIKAKAICMLSGMPAIADDSGLIVDALGGEPGVYSSSYGGEDLCDNGRFAYLLEKMKNLEQRNARFVCVIVCVFPDGSMLSSEGECHGKIADMPRGLSGFGYDPVFLVDGTDKTMAELSADEKNKLSHRGIALRKFSQLLMASNYIDTMAKESDQI